MKIAHAVLLSALATVPAFSQISFQSPTRFSIGVTPVMAQPEGEFRSNVGRGWGGGGSVQYRLDSQGFVSWRFDLSWAQYGSETRRLPFETGRILLKQTTTNSITSMTTGPEFAVPAGPFRPYVNAGWGGLVFRTVSSINGDNSSGDGPIASTTNLSDTTSTWVFGTGVRIPLEKTQFVGLDLGVRYYSGGEADYLREGSIRDNPNGSITFNALHSQTPHLVYMVGVRFRIPFNSPRPCPRLLC